MSIFGFLSVCSFVVYRADYHLCQALDFCFFIFFVLYKFFYILTLAGIISVYQACKSGTFADQTWDTVAQCL